MKREIKFRGKVEIGVKEPFWIYGYLVIYNNKSTINPFDENSYHRYIVNSDSVGQFTGLQDKNGKDIFEGDIVASTCNKMKPKKDETDLFETPEFELKTFHNVIDWFNGVRISGWRIKGKGFQTQLKWSTGGNMNLKVIGNIYDNPELLK